MSPSSFSTHDGHAESSSHANKSTSGLTLVLPPLSAVKAQKGKKKIKLTYEEPVRKAPRPLKLKPLKEVLSKLITQIKKKDDYAFFLQPVDPAQVPGYSDVVSRPMDLGTMTTKVERGKYRSLEEFASDLRLVTSNAKTFNPPGTIYHIEAERLENYALEHIAKAAATVIEYETDWNIEIEKDEDPVNVDDDDTSGAVGTPVEKTAGTPMDVDESRAGSPLPGSVQAGGGRRTKGKKPGSLSESLEPDGGLPGAKDGLGAFPPGSDWAETMLALKLKGKRYRTKKERMRFERTGPPYTAEGSLDYTEMEDPFSVLSALVPDPPSRPLLEPLYPSLEPPDPSRPPLPAPVNIIPAEDVPTPSGLAPLPPLQSTSRTKPSKRRHWTIVRNSTRGRARDAVPEEEPVPPWKTPREPYATDFGTFALLPSLLAEERRVSDVGSQLGSEEKLFDALRLSVQSPKAGPRNSTTSEEVKMETDPDSYWEGKAGEAETYIRDLVYGGVDGFAYVRSLAEFLTPSEPIERHGDHGELGMPVAQWVEENVINPLTDGRHGVLREAAHMLRDLPPTPPPEPSATSTSLPAPSAPLSDPIRHQIELSLYTYPAAARALETLETIAKSQIDLPSLIRAPDELFRAEDVWAGREYRERHRREMDEALARDPDKNAAAYLQWAIEEHREAEASASTAATAEDSGMLEYALQRAADEIERFVKGKAGVPEEDTSVEPKGEESASDVSEDDHVADGDIVMKTEDDAPPSDPPPSDKGESGESGTENDKPDGEDPGLKKLRLNLLALAKRAPLDQIMKLPAELVPAHLRHIVPTADA
ncbi:hypothetical protein BD413DRAFT_311580 [Trametes elegans]|nr:hypothetical protein BD413DRAFT_311580 [Trametes elegans]